MPSSSSSSSSWQQGRSNDRKGGRQRMNVNVNNNGAVTTIKGQLVRDFISDELYASHTGYFNSTVINYSPLHHLQYVRGFGG
jgi:hypothetical protein